MALYTDFDISFKLNDNGDISTLSDEDCIRQVIKNSVNMESWDIPFNKWYGANLKYYLFEHPNKITEAEMSESIRTVLLLDRRLKDPEIKISYSNDYQYCTIDIKVYVIILDKTIDQQITVERVR